MTAQNDLEQDLVLFTIGGVQRFITEARTTADLANASNITSVLAETAATQFTPQELVIPASVDKGGTPNRIVAVTDAGTGISRAKAAAEAVHEAWRSWVKELFGRDIEVPGFPDTVWSVSPAATGDYAARWREADEALIARRRLRLFDAAEFAERRPCSLAPRWVAEQNPPPGVPDHERGDELSAAGWLKRRWHLLKRLPSSPDARPFASTAAIASARYRATALSRLDEPEVAGAVARLREAAQRMLTKERFPVLEASVPALQWNPENPAAEWLARGAGLLVSRDAWHVDQLRRRYKLGEGLPDGESVQEGHAAATELSKVLDGAVPNTYYALLALDLDNMGSHLTEGEVTAERHRDVSRRLIRVAERQRSVIEKAHGVPVYAGGDDLLALLPAHTALAAVRKCRSEAEAEDALPTASGAVLFVYAHSPLSHAVSQVQELLAAAKNARRAKDAVSVGFITNSGTAYHLARPWSLPDVGDTIEALRTFLPRSGPDNGEDLSPRIVADLHRSQGGLTELAERSDGGKFYRKEITRLVERHGGSQRDAEVLCALGRDHQGRAHVPTLVDAVRVAAFLRREAW